MKRGYARVSTTDQDLDLQRAELKAAGCAKVYEDKLSGKSADRPGLKKLLREVQRGDVVIVYKVDRMSRSVRDLLNITHDLGQRGVEFRSLHDPIDTTNGLGRAFFQLVAVFAELERSFIVERTAAGRKIARKKPGYREGRKPKLTAEQVAMARDLLKSHTLASVAKSMGVHRITLYRYLNEEKRTR
jgi:DNA invertase Pin-like site-specific DNA recombinase